MKMNRSGFLKSILRIVDLEHPMRVLQRWPRLFGQRNPIL